MFYYPFYFDPTYILVLVGVVICMAASARVNSTYSRYSRVRNHAGITGAMAAEQILRQAGIYDVRIERVSGKLTDHFDPRTKVVRLSDSTYGSTSVAALGVAAHECGHAIQYAEGYFPIKLRSAIIPATQIGSQLALPLFFLGLIFSYSPLMNAGILLFALVAVFQLVTLPVEFNASRRAVEILSSSGMVSGEEERGVRSVLSAAALTYVAALATALANLLRLVLIAGRRNRD